MSREEIFVKTPLFFLFAEGMEKVCKVIDEHFCFCFCDVFLCCPVICANLGGTSSVPHVPASQPLATSKAHSALQPHHTKSLWWCSVMPVLIQHPQDTHLYAPF